MDTTDYTSLPRTKGTVKTLLGSVEYERVTYVDPYPGREDDEILDEWPCDRCGGAGEISAYRYIEGGRCFQCGGDAGYRHQYTVGKARADRKREVDAINAGERARIKSLVATEAVWTEAKDFHPIWKFAREHVETNSFISQLVDRLDDGKALSEKQLRAGADSILRDLKRREEREREDAMAEPVISGRYEVTGTVLSTKWVDSAYGGTKKMLVRDDRGFKVWGTVPSSLDEIDGLLSTETMLKVGQRVRFTATVSRSGDDLKFGFFKRPAKATRLDG